MRAASETGDSAEEVLLSLYTIFVLRHADPFSRASREK